MARNRCSQEESGLLQRVRVNKVAPYWRESGGCIMAALFHAEVWANNTIDNVYKSPCMNHASHVLSLLLVLLVAVECLVFLVAATTSTASRAALW